MNGILFDLDGTLIDSAPAVIGTIRYLAERYGFPMATFESLRPYTGTGLAALIKRCDPTLSTQQCHDLAREGFDHYKHTAPGNTPLLPGTRNLLEMLDTRDLPWGLVTNKHRELTEAIATRLPILDQAHTLVCRDDLAVCKPHPYPLLKAGTNIGTRPSHTLYVGDSHHDMLAAQAAGMPGIIAAYGYIEAGADIHNWPHYGIIDHIQQVTQWITI